MNNDPPNYASASFADLDAERQRLDEQMKAMLGLELATYHELGLPQPGPELRLLDVGSGSGAPAMALRGLGFEVTCFDADRAALDLLPSELSRRVHGQAHELPFPDSSFDVVYSRLVMQHVPDPAAAAAEMLRVARSSGVVIVVDTDHDTWITHPPIPSVEAARAGFIRDARARGCDPCIGRRLPQLFSSGTRVEYRVLSPSTGTVDAAALAQILFQPFLRYAGVEMPADDAALRAWTQSAGAFASANVVVVAATP